MVDKKEQQEEHDELDLDAESVKDLDVDEADAEQLRGGVGPVASLSGYSVPHAGP